MKFDQRLITGLLVGTVFGLHYHETLVTYVPILIIASMILLLKMIHH